MYHSNPSPDSVAPVRVTMSTIAASLGVTKTTVSLALRNHPSISKPTTAKVREMAEKLGYRPDPAISAIATHRWGKASSERHRVIAYICNGNQTPQAFFIKSATRKANQLGYKLEVFDAEEYPSGQSITRVLYTRGIRGIIIPPIQNPESQRIAKLDWSKFTAVCCGIGRMRPPLHTVTPDTFAHTSLVWNVLKEAGFKRIGAALYRHDPIAHDDWLRLGASTAAINVFDLKESANIPIYTGNFADSKSLLDWYREYKPEVIIGFNESVCKQLEANGISIPGDVQFVTLLTNPGTKYSGIIHLFDEIAEKSVELLDAEMRHNHWGVPQNPKVTLVRPHWNTGTTLCVVPEATDDRIDNIIEPILSQTETISKETRQAALSGEYQ